MGVVVCLDQFSDRFLNGLLYELGFGGGCGSGGKVVHLILELVNNCEKL